MSTIPSVGMKESRNELGEIVRRARLHGESTILTNRGKPAAAVVPFEDFSELQRLREEAAVQKKASVAGVGLAIERIE